MNIKETRSDGRHDTFYGYEPAKLVIGLRLAASTCVRRAAAGSFDHLIYHQVNIYLFVYVTFALVCADNIS